MHKQTYRRNIGDGVHHSYLMEMDFRHRPPMRMAFRFRDEVINGHDIFLNVFLDCQPVYELLDVPHGSVMMPMMMVVAVIMIVTMLVIVVMSVPMVAMLMLFFMTMVFTLFNAMYHHPHLTSAYSAFHHDFSGNLYARYSEAVQLRNKTLLLFRRQEFKECRGQHISCGTHSQIQI